MEKKDLKKRQTTWTCKHNCNIESTTCKHIESLIAVTNGKMSREFREKLQMRNLVEQRIEHQDDYELHYVDTRQALINFGLSKYDTELLMDKFVDRLSLQEMAKTRGYRTHGGVLARLNKVLDSVKSNNELKSLLRGRSEN